MNHKEVNELKRRFKVDRNNIRKIYTCYVSLGKEIISISEKSVAMMPEDEQEKYFTLLKKTLSGAIGRTLTNIDFTTDQVQNGEEHQLLMKLRASSLNDEEARTRLFENIAKSLQMETSYTIILCGETYDVPIKRNDEDDDGDTAFNYFLCGICPVKDTKACLCYDHTTKAFENQPVGAMLAPPELGFLFPAFDDRAANIYGALYYVKDEKASYDNFVEAVFRLQDPPAAVSAQTSCFRDILTDTLEEQCSEEVVRTIHKDIQELVRTHEESKDPEPLTVTPEDVGRIISRSGVSEKHAQTFRKLYGEVFGENSAVAPQNLLDAEKLEYKTPDVLIKVSPDRQDLIETKNIDGVNYIIIRAEEGVKINGISVTQAERED